MRRLAADGWPLAKAASALASSYLAQVQRDVDTALAWVDEIAPADAATRRASQASRFVSLGHPERVKETLDDVLEHLKFSSLAWTNDNKGIFYSVPCI